jgi:hypothetical protein
VSKMKLPKSETKFSQQCFSPRGGMYIAVVQKCAPSQVGCRRLILNSVCVCLLGRHTTHSAGKCDVRLFATPHRAAINIFPIWAVEHCASR